jgi:hypothetical protein
MPTNTLSNAADVAVVNKTITDPAAFSRAVLKADIWETQEQLLTALTKYKRIAVKSCHASGKTFTFGLATLWWLARYPDGVVITTAPITRQVERVLWGEIRTSIQRSRSFWPKDAEVLRKEFRLGESNYAIGFATDEGVNFQGYHGRILLIIDEAMGITGDIWEAIEGIRAGGDVTLLAGGNPTVPGGVFYDLFRQGGWYTITMSVFDTPNFQGVSLEKLLTMNDEELDTNVRPYLATRRWAREKYEEWGPDSPQWQSRVMGQFPQQDSASLFNLSDLEWARAYPGEDKGGTVYAGLDVAGEGDNRTVLLLREAGNIIKIHSWNAPDPKMQVAAALEPYRDRLGAVMVDASGMGYHFVMRLQEMGIPAVGIRGEVAASDPNIYLNKRAELYFRLRSWLERHRLVGLTDETLYKQLALIRTRSAESVRGRLAIETKEEMRRRGVESPDYADALVLACAKDSPATLRQPTDSLYGNSPGLRNRTIGLRTMRSR